MTNTARVEQNYDRCPCTFTTLSFGLQEEAERGSCKRCPHPLTNHGPSGCHAYDDHLT